MLWTLDNPASVGLSDNAVVKSKLLCFITDKTGMLPLDDLVKVCSDFCREEEIVGAWNIIEKAGHRLPKRKGGDKLKYTVEDCIKTVLHPDAQLLTFFYAIDLPTHVISAQVTAETFRASRT